MSKFKLTVDHVPASKSNTGRAMVDVYLLQRKGLRYKRVAMLSATRAEATAQWVEAAGRDLKRYAAALEKVDGHRFAA